MLLTELLDGLDAQELGRCTGISILDVVHDDRRVVAGSLFACMPGEQSDGHNFAASALVNGAVALLVERPLDLDVPQVLVPSVRSALGPIAARVMGNPSRTLPVFGVTGTNGKTTVTYLLDGILRAQGLRSAIIGTTGVRVGEELIPTGFTTPEADELQRWIARLRDDSVQAIAMEVSSHALHARRVGGMRFAAAGFTNLSHDHLDYHETMEAYFDAKTMLFSREYTDAAAILSAGPWGAAMLERASAAGLTVIDVGVDLIARDVEMHAHGTDAIVEDRRSGESGALHLPLVGPYNLNNALVAIGMWRAHGGALDVALRGCGMTQPVPGRLERIDAGQAFSVLVDYAHTPDALEHVLRAARELAGDAQVIVVIGCGGDRDPLKRPHMGRIAATLADIAVITSDNPRSEDPRAIADAMLAGTSDTAGDVRCILDRRDAIAKALELANRGDVVVIAGKGHETGQTAQGVTLPFDDRTVATEWLESH
ncbi:MAG: UDP-N-acetylmuramoyl-L-alanyl-D-glutamate--2,6-diaminopimelate ligase [Acidimicrobiia bacterium]